MSFVDRIASAIMPTESEQVRFDARKSAQAKPLARGLLSTRIDHHRQIQDAFSRANGAERLTTRFLEEYARYVEPKANLPQQMGSIG